MNQIRFRCVRCQHSLKAKGDAAGKKMLCPVCYQELTVPNESTIKEADPSQLYTADEKPIDVREMQERKEFASLRCRVCHTNIAVKKEQVGQEVVCPDCDTKMIVPAEIAARIDGKMKDTLDKIMLGLEEPPKHLYGVRDGSANAPLEDWTKRFPVYCKLCNTLMYAREEQIGQELTCPDCHTKTVVPPKPKELPRTGQIPTTFEGATTFGLEKERPVSNEPLVSVVCSLCGTRMYAKESEIGGVKTCPDCGRQAEIKPVPKEELLKPEPVGGEYGISVSETPPTRPTARTMTDYRYVDGSLDKGIYGAEQPDEKTVRQNPFSPSSLEYNAQDNIDAETIRQRKLRKKASTDREIATVIHRRPPLPQQPFIERFFSPMLSWSVMVRMLITFGIFSVGALLCVAFPGLLRIFGLALGGVLFLIGSGVHVYFCMNVFHFSTEGNDRFDEWTEFSLPESLLNLAWLFSLAIVAAAPGVFFANMLPGDALIKQINAEGAPTLIPNLPILFRDFLLMQLTLGILFPIFFLSCMESGSYFTILAQNTLKSLLRHTGVWVRFYLLSVVLVLTPEFIYFGLCGSLRNLFGDFFLVAVFVLLFFGLACFATFFYARLVGRLGWILEESARLDNEDDDE